MEEQCLYSPKIDLQCTSRQINDVKNVVETKRDRLNSSWVVILFTPYIVLLFQREKERERHRQKEKGLNGQLITWNLNGHKKKKRRKNEEEGCMSSLLFRWSEPTHFHCSNTFCTLPHSFDYFTVTRRPRLFFSRIFWSVTKLPNYNKLITNRDWIKEGAITVYRFQRRIFKFFVFTDN